MAKRTDNKTIFMGKGLHAGHRLFLLQNLDNGTQGEVPFYGYGMPPKIKPDWEITPENEDCVPQPKGPRVNYGSNGPGFRQGDRSMVNEFLST